MDRSRTIGKKNYDSGNVLRKATALQLCRVADSLIISGIGMSSQVITLGAYCYLSPSSSINSTDFEYQAPLVSTEIGTHRLWDCRTLPYTESEIAVLCCLVGGWLSAGGGTGWGRCRLDLLLQRRCRGLRPVQVVSHLLLLLFILFYFYLFRPPAQGL